MLFVTRKFQLFFMTVYKTQIYKSVHYIFFLAFSFLILIFGAYVVNNCKHNNKCGLFPDIYLY